MIARYLLKLFPHSARHVTLLNAGDVCIHSRCGQRCMTEPLLGSGFRAPGTALHGHQKNGGDRGHKTLRQIFLKHHDGSDDAPAR